MENKNLKCEEACDLLTRLPLDERFNVIAILLEHWNAGRINEGNYNTDEEAYERGREVYTPDDAGLENVFEIASKFAALARHLKNETDEHIACSVFSDLIEPHIIKTAEMESALTAFFSLTFKDKLDYFCELFEMLENEDWFKDIENISFDDFDLDTYGAIDMTLNFKSNLKTFFPEITEELPFDIKEG